MKIGTLTLHLPFNYGNALQMFSLHKYLLEQGYDAEVLSHWFYENRNEILYWHNYIRLSWINKIKFILYCCTWTGQFCRYLREAKLKKWLDSMLRWSHETGANSHFPTESISHDIVIVGSDQIWNPKYKTSEFFLLPDFPDRIHKVAYAASLGSDDFPNDLACMYARNLEKFKAISVRESSAVKILEDKCGIKATLVADPTLLHTKAEWCKILDVSMPKESGRDYMVYTVTPDGVARWKELVRLARKVKGKVHVFAFTATSPNISLKNPFFVIFQTMYRRILLWCSGVRLHFASTPTEFVQCLANCEGLFTDSFHGMMFATIFEKKCNVIIGNHEERQQMGARLRNFTSDFGCPEIITPEFDLSALRELKVTTKMQALIEFSKNWLKDAIEACHA